jgi:tetratricopeptide (TPR) repeat protein
VVPYCEESIALYRELGDEEGMAFPLATLADLGFGQADRERGIALLQESLDLYRQAGNKWGIRHVLGLLGLTYAYAMEQFDQAGACFEESLALARELGVPDGIAFSLYCLGILAFFCGDDEQAMALFTEELPLSHAIGQRYLVIESLFYLEMIALHQGEFEQAKALAREALAEEIRGTGLRASWRLSLLDADAPWRSEALLLDNLALARKSNDRPVIAHVLFRLAGSAWSLGQLEKAVRLYAAALAASGFAPSMPPERTDFDHTLTGTPVRLDETTFKKAWAEGSAMTVEQAAADALAGKCH